MPALRRAALQKLFSDPHFNVMDGLDTYIDDYSQPNPLPPAMLAGLRQAQNILAWAKETKEETAARFAPPPEESARVAGEAAGFNRSHRFNRRRYCVAAGGAVRTRSHARAG